MEIGLGFAGDFIFPDYIIQKPRHGNGFENNCLQQNENKIERIDFNQVDKCNSEKKYSLESKNFYIGEQSFSNADINERNNKSYEQNVCHIRANYFSSEEFL